MKKLLAVIVITLTALMLMSQAHGLELIESQRFYPKYVTVGDDFTICVQIKDNTCQENTIEATYIYDMIEGDLFPLQQYIEKYHFNADDLEDTSVWCGKAVGKEEQRVDIRFQCRDHLDQFHMDTNNDDISYGYIHVNLTSKFENERLFGKHVGEILELEAYLQDSDDMDIYYSVYNVTKGIVPFIAEEKMQKIEGQYKANLTIPYDSPYGFIEFRTDYLYYWKFGGKFIPYAAIPYKSEISVDGNTTMGSTIDLAFGIAVEYGKINSVSTEITLPNWTVQKIYLDHVNTSASYTIPMLPGNYTIESIVDHTTLDGRKTIKNFYVKPYELDIDSGIKVYEQGDTITIKVGVIDSNNTAVNLTDVLVYIQRGYFYFKRYDDEDMSLENRYYKLTHKIEENDTTGEYIVYVGARDEYGLEYYGNKSFTVNKRTRKIEFTLTPPTYNKEIESMNETSYRFTIKNTGTLIMNKININIESLEQDQYIEVKRDNLTEPLKPGNSTTFRVIIRPDEDMENKLYRKNISVTSGKTTEKITVVLDVSLTAEMMILNKTIVTEVLKNKEHKIRITIENAGTRSLTGITASLTGSLKEYVNEITPPQEIVPNSRGYIIISFKPIENENSYNAEVEMGGDNVTSAKAEIKLDVVEDFGSDIDTVDNKRIILVGRLEKLTNTGATGTGIVDQDLTDLQVDISDMRSMYLNGQYSEAKSMLASIQSKADGIDEELTELESSETKCGNGICDSDEDYFTCPADCGESEEGCDYDGECDWDTEDCDCEDCEDEDDCIENGGGGSPILIILVIIIVVIIVAVVATSVVPDDDGQDSYAIKNK